MKIVIDKNIAYAKEAFQSFGDLQLVKGRTITNKDLKDADALIVRSITKVNQSLLEGSKVKFVGTATIGTDHIDIPYLKENNISFANAKGCNADSVTEYVFTSIFKIAAEQKITIKDKTIGVVGIGNIGSRIVRIAEVFDLKVLKNDPPLERDGKGTGYVSLNEILKAGIITFHVPLNKEGIDKTVHLLDKKNLSQISDDAIIINTSRGPVINNNDLLEVLSGRNLLVNLDVWETEPAISIKLLSKIKTGTPHIAGYSFDGKVNGTKMIYDSFCKYLGKKSEWIPSMPLIENAELVLPEGKNEEEILYKLCSSVYDIERDDKQMRKVIDMEENKRPEYFDKLRSEYPKRREFSNYSVIINKEQSHLRQVLEALKFKVKIN